MKFPCDRFLHVSCAYPYNELLATGLTPDTPPEDHPWGDRGFALRDPNGVMLYIYSDREPAPEFRTAFLGGADA